MMETKKQFKYFTIFEYEKEQEYLSLMHRNGWRFTNVSGFGVYRFEKCEPAEVVYRLDYNQEGLENKEEYVKMFADCGWEYIKDYVGYSYFRKPVTEEDKNPEIFCDEDSRLHMMERVMKGRMIPLLVLFLCVLLPQFILNLTVYRNYVLSAVYGTILLIYVSVFLISAKKYGDYKYNSKR